MISAYVTHFWHYGGTSVLGKRVCRIMHYAAIIVSDSERVGGFLRSLLKISNMVYIDNDTLLIIYLRVLYFINEFKEKNL